MNLTRRISIRLTIVVLVSQWLVGYTIDTSMSNTSQTVISTSSTTVASTSTTTPTTTISLSTTSQVQKSLTVTETSTTVTSTSPAMDDTTTAWANGLTGTTTSITTTTTPTTTNSASSTTQVQKTSTVTETTSTTVTSTSPAMDGSTTAWANGLTDTTTSITTTTTPITTNSVSTTTHVQNCGPLKHSANITFSTTETAVGTNVTISCVPGYTYNKTDNVITCTTTTTGTPTWKGLIGICLKEVSLGQSCLMGMDVCNVTNATCSASNVCECDDHFYKHTEAEFNESSCLPKLPLGHACAYNHSCKDTNAECVSEECICQAGFFDDNGAAEEGVCISKLHLGQSCEEIHSCNDSHAECVSDKCVCQAGFFDDNGATEGGVCKLKLHLGQSCEDIHSCNDIHAECVSDKCACQSGFFDDNGATEGVCKLKLHLGQSCEVIHSCNDTNAKCVSDKCVCQAGFFDDNGATEGGVCKLNLPLGHACAYNHSCKDTNAECVSGECICQAGFFDDNGAAEEGLCILKTNPNVTVFNQTTASILLLITKGNIPTDHFHITSTGCDESISTDKTNHNCSLDSNTTALCNIEALNSSTCYLFRIIATQDDKLDMDTETNETAWTAPDSTYQFGIYKQESLRLLVHWSCKSRASYFNVENETSLFNQNVYAFDQSGVDFSAFITHLTPATSYNFRIRACSNTSGLCGSTEGYIPMKTLPEAPIKCFITDRSNDCVTLQWSPVSGKFDQYLIIYSDDQEIHTLNLSEKVHALIGNTAYMFQIHSVWGDLKSEPCNVGTRTKPSPPKNVTFVDHQDTSLTLSWNAGDGNAIGLVYAVQLTGNTTPIDTSNTSYVFNGLTSGTRYTANLTAMFGENMNETYTWLESHPVLKQTYTRPTKLKMLDIAKVHENNMTFKLEVNDYRFESFWVDIHPQPTGRSECSNNTLSNTTASFTCDNLVSMTEYTVRVYTQIGEIRSSPTSKPQSTAPQRPNASITAGETDLLITVDAKNKLDYFYSVCTNGSIIKNRTAVKKSDAISELTPGTQYDIYIKSRYNGIDCDTPTAFRIYTVPSEVGSISVLPINSTSLNISWAQGNGSCTHYTIDYNCISPDSGQINNIISDNTTNVSFLKAGLSPGTTCLVSVTAHAGNQTGINKTTERAQGTFEKAPGEVTSLDVDMVKDQSNLLSVSWSPPSSKNGIIRAYVVQVLELKECYHLSCNDCSRHVPDTCEDGNKIENVTCQEVQQFDSLTKDFQMNVTNLTAYTNYSVEVAAFTMCKGEQETTSARTDEDKPGKPGTPSIVQATSSSLNINWDSPSFPNGIIIEYKLKYVYEERECRKHGSNTTNSEVLNSTSESMQNYTIEGLYAAWDYTISIQAKTSKGYGEISESIVRQTNESVPGTVDAIISKAGSYNISLQWLPPCHANGVIQYYTVSWKNIDETTDSGHKSSVTTNITFMNIRPYRNYTFQVAAVTSIGPGNFTNDYEVQSKIAEPNPPSGLEPSPLNSTAIHVSWKVILPDFYTGPTTYTARACDVVNNTISKSCDAHGFNATGCNITNLDQYWNYSISVDAITTDGNASLRTSSNESKTITTLEDTPGPVYNVVATPEDDVTKIRSITVTWHQPTKRNLNGILTGYFIKYTYNNTIEHTERTEPDNTQFILKTKIRPGQYSIMILAATVKGNATEITSPHAAVIVTPGAPLKPVETAGNTIVRQASNENIDSKREIAVYLDLQAFLCNSSNGKPTMWGVIVAQDSRAKASSLSTSKEKFNKTLVSYKRWIDVKDKDDIDPYRATGNNWTPSCPNISSRRKRSSESSQAATVTPFVFVVGKDKDCKGKTSRYCNGQLPPGRSYRVKTFVCTDGGCTESDYSSPIKTDRYEPPISASDPTIPIVAGVISALVVIACIVIVLFLKRRQTLCFAKNIEEQTFDQPQIEMKGTSRFRPIVVKLADFPSYVDVLHRDSGLLFADGFRLLKEQSPVHPTTVAETQACRPKTRYTNILPFDHSRVKLLPLDDEDGSDFINANYIPGYTSRREYIATQGPLPATKDDFWRMIWEQNVDIIVMLTRCIEKGKRKCDEYWPEVVQEPVYSGDLIVNVQSESVLSDYIIRVIELKLKKETRVIRQFSYLKWPDMGSPDDSSMLLNFVKTVRQFVNPGNSGPMVVHCSAGVGRTGTFIAVDRLLQHIRDHDDVDIYSVILDMRNQRCNMVQTEDQFVYIYECIRDFITTDEEEEEEEEEDEHLYANTGIGQNIYENTAFQHE